MKGGLNQVMLRCRFLFVWLLLVLLNPSLKSSKIEECKLSHKMTKNTFIALFPYSNRAFTDIKMMFLFSVNLFNATCKVFSEISRPGQEN